MYKLIVLILLVCTKINWAAVPTTMPYQGFLTETNGAPVTAIVPMVFSLYDDIASNSNIWQETHPSVSIVSGVFEAQLGSIQNLDPALFNQPLFLGVAVDGDSEMSPRTIIGSVPFSFAADHLSNCSVGLSNCNGVCSDLLTDAQNCGACDLSCSAGAPFCNAGSCAVTLDGDNDGFTIDQGDCNDNDPDINPGAAEICNGIDENCDLGIDEGTDTGCAAAIGTTACSTGICGFASGCIVNNANMGTLCDDGDICTTSDMCDGAGACSAIAVNCDDGNQCTTSACDSSTGCISSPTPVGAACNDGNLCTINDTCDGTGSCSSTPVNCDDGNMCTTDLCDPSGGNCSNTPVTNGIDCGGGQTCLAGICQ